jgi:hypothetical protein
MIGHRTNWSRLRLTTEYDNPNLDHPFIRRLNLPDEARFGDSHHATEYWQAFIILQVLLGLLPHAKIVDLINAANTVQDPSHNCPSFQQVNNVAREKRLLDLKTAPTTLRDIGRYAVRRLLKTICRLKMDKTGLFILGALLIPSVEAMPNGILDRPMDTSNNAGWTSQIARVFAPSAAGVAAVAARSTRWVDCIQPQTSGIGAWISSFRRTILGVSTLGHCIAWMVIVELIDQGRSDLVKV